LERHLAARALWRALPQRRKQDRHDHADDGDDDEQLDEREGTPRRAVCAPDSLLHARVFGWHTSRFGFSPEFIRTIAPEKLLQGRRVIEINIAVAVDVEVALAGEPSIEVFDVDDSVAVDVIPRERSAEGRSGRRGRSCRGCRRPWRRSCPPSLV
jgi:hypothetical protein